MRVDEWRSRHEVLNRHLLNGHLPERTRRERGHDLPIRNANRDDAKGDHRQQNQERRAYRLTRHERPDIYPEHY